MVRSDMKLDRNASKDGLLILQQWKEGGSGTLPDWQAEPSMAPLVGCGRGHVPVGQAPQ